jgi:hypothetical protein
MKPLRLARARTGHLLKLQAVILAALCGASACEQSHSTLVIVVGGLGASQMSDLHDALTREFPDATIISAGGWDGYKADVNAIIAQNPRRHIVLVGHSLGCQTIARAAEQVSSIDLTVFIDPCWDDIQLPKNVDRYLWYQRSGFGFERKARIIGASAPTTIQGSHNGIAHAPMLIEEVLGAVRETRGEKSVLAAAR